MSFIGLGGFNQLPFTKPHLGIRAVVRHGWDDLTGQTYISVLVPYYWPFTILLILKALGAFRRTRRELTHRVGFEVLEDRGVGAEGAKPGRE